MRTDPLTMPASRWKTTRDAVTTFGPASVLAFAPFVFLKTPGEFENIPKMAVLQWSAGLLALLRLIDARSARPACSPIVAAPLAFYLTCWTSLFWAESPILAAIPLSHLACAVIFFYLFAWTPHPQTASRSLLVAAALSSSLVSMVGLVQHVFDFDWIPQVATPASTFANRNLASQFVAICCPLALGLIIVCRGRITRTLTIAGLLVSGCYLYITRTRSAWLAIAIVMLVGLLLVVHARHKRRPLPRRVLIGASLVGAVVLFGGIPAGVLVLDNATQDSASLVRISNFAKVGSGSTRSRVMYWKNTSAMIADHFPGGIGLANFAIEYPLYQDAGEPDWTFNEVNQIQRAHNDHLQILAELGLPGFATYVVLIALFLNLWRKTLRSSERDIPPLTGAIGLSIVAFVVVATFSFPMSRAMPPVYLFASLGSITALASTAGSQRVTTRTQSWVRVGLSAIVVAYLGSSGLVMSRAIMSNVYQDRAREALDAGASDEVERHLVRARDLAIGDSAPAIMLAQFCAGQGRLEETVNELVDVLRTYPNDISTLINVGYACIQLDRHEEAEQFLNRAIGIAPDSLTAHSNLGLLHFRTQKFELAAGHYLRVLELSVSDKYDRHPRRRNDLVLVARIQLGAIFAALDEPMRAVEYYEQALSQNPSLSEVRSTIEKLKRRDGISRDAPNPE